MLWACDIELYCKICNHACLCVFHLSSVLLWVYDMIRRCLAFFPFCSGSVKKEDFLRILRLKPCSLSEKVCACTSEIFAELKLRSATLISCMPFWTCYWTPWLQFDMSVWMLQNFSVRLPPQHNTRIALLVPAKLTFWFFTYIGAIPY